MTVRYKADKYRYTMFANVRSNVDAYLTIDPVYWLPDPRMSLRMS